jgi:uncharacterized protein (UPF0218 family)
LDYVNGVERFSPVEVLTVEDLMRTHMMEREKNKNIPCIVIKNHTERKRRTKRYRSEEQASHVIKGSPGHAMPTTTLLENPPTLLLCLLLLEELISF